MVAVSVQVRRRGFKVRSLIKALDGFNAVGEVFIRGAFNNYKAGELKRRGHDPFAVPRPVAFQGRKVIKKAILTGDRRRMEIAVLKAARLVRDALKHRITTGGLGMNAPKYRTWKYHEAIAGRATRSYGMPPPYGVLTGRMVRAFQARLRHGR